MKINRNNYESYFLDYAEGKLEPEMVQELRLFLEQNRDLKEEMEDFEIITLKPEKVSQDLCKDKLRYEETPQGTAISKQNFDLYCISYLENDLAIEQQKAFLRHVSQNKDLAGEFGKFKMAKIRKDQAIVCPDRNKLKRSLSHKDLITITQNRYFRIAASILIIIGLTIPWLFQTVQQSPGNRYSRQPSLNNMIALNSTAIILNAPETIIPGRTEKNEIILPKEETRYYVSSMPILATSEISTEKFVAVFERRTFDNYPLPAPLPGFNEYSGYALAENNPPGKNSAVQRIFNNLKGKVRDVLAPAAGVVDFSSKEKVSFWDIADSGIKGYNLITNNDYQLIRKVNDQGKTEYVRIVDPYQAAIERMNP